MCNYTQGSVISKEQPSLKSAINLALEWCSDNDVRFGLFIETVQDYGLSQEEFWTTSTLSIEDELLARLIVRYVEDHQ